MVLNYLFDGFHLKSLLCEVFAGCSLSFVDCLGSHWITSFRGRLVVPRVQHSTYKVRAQGCRGFVLTIWRAVRILPFERVSPRVVEGSGLKTNQTPEEPPPFKLYRTIQALTDKGRSGDTGAT